MSPELKGDGYTYQIKKILGQGTFGITYLATTSVQTKATISGGLGEIEEEGEVIIKVAVKEFFMSELNSRAKDGSSIEGSNSQLTKNYRKKFRREAENLSHLNHPNIVKVLEVFDANNTTYYSMRYINGQSLDDYIKEKGGLDEKEAISLIKPIAEALQYMHDHKMLHLDLKPKNIMLDKHGKPYLIDFGLSKQYDESGEPESSTSIGLGTPGYAPIEQANYKQDGSFPATLDVYALGATLYKMLTGKTPPTASDVLLYGVTLPEGLSATIRQTIINAMNPKRTERLQSVAAFLDSLDDDSDNEDTQTDTGKVDEEKTTVDVSNAREANDAQEKSDKHEKNDVHEKQQKKVIFPKSYIYGLIACVAAIVIGIFLFSQNNDDEGKSQNDQIADVTEQVQNTLPPVLQNLVDNMVRVEGGTFTMGATSEQGSDAYSDEKPAHQVTLSSFSIGKYEVTQEEWEAVMGSNPSRLKGAKKPVEQVSWNDCQAFIRKLNELTGRNFRLPTEAEWEFAARGGTKSIGYKYAGGDNIGNVAWYTDNSGSTTHDVGQKSPNELGLYDMSGNVWEWCQDWYGSYSSSSQTNPKGASSGSVRVNRGGGWFPNAGFCRVSSRYSLTPSFQYFNLGFRLAF